MVTGVQPVAVDANRFNPPQRLVQKLISSKSSQRYPFHEGGAVMLDKPLPVSSENNAASLFQSNSNTTTGSTFDPEIMANAFTY